MNNSSVRSLIVFALVMTPRPAMGQALDVAVTIGDTERTYLSAIRHDFVQHRENVSLLYNIGVSIVERIDSLFTEQRADTANTELVRDIMITRQYDRTVVAYREILNGTYVSDPLLKLLIARHVARFEGYAESKREWDRQWDGTARPLIYKHGLFSYPAMVSSREVEKLYNLYRDPEFRSVLWDRRMFARDVSFITPALMESADAIIARIDELLRM